MYLSEIISANGHDKIIFEYEEKDIQYQLRVSSSYATTDFGMGSFSRNAKRYHGTQGKRLKKIKWYKLEGANETQLGEAEFVKDEVNERVDLKNDYALKKIIIKDFISGTEKMVKQFALNHFYAADRLFLESVIEENAQGGAAIMKPYILSYYNVNVFDEHELNGYPLYTMDYDLPIRNSTNQDYWGYSNGQDNDGLYIPTLIPYFWSPNRQDVIEGADRTPHFEYAVTGTLKEINSKSLSDRNSGKLLPWKLVSFV